MFNYIILLLCFTFSIFGYFIADDIVTETKYFLSSDIMFIGLVLYHEIRRKK